MLPMVQAPFQAFRIMYIIYTNKITKIQNTNIQIQNTNTNIQIQKNTKIQKKSQQNFWNNFLNQIWKIFQIV